MNKKNTDELEKILGSTHPNDMEHFLDENKDSLLEQDRPFKHYMDEKLKEKGLQRYDVFIAADIPDRYGYKLLSGEKRTKRRDVIIRLCYAAEFSLDELQKALKIYEMPQLYAKIKRDALIMVCFNQRPGSILEVNSFLKKNSCEPLNTVGSQE